MPQSPNRYYDGPSSGHYDGARFFNPGQPATERSVRDMLRWRFGGTRVPWVAEAEPARIATPKRRVDGLAITAIGHSSLLVQVAGLNLLVDPVWSERASPVRFAGPRRANPPGIAFDSLPAIDAVLISHNHYDHLDMETLTRLHQRHSPRMIAPLGNDMVIRSAIAGAQVQTGDWGDCLSLAGAVSVALHPAYHWSARGLRDRRMALWCGFVLLAPPGPVYLAGDTGYGDGAIFHAVQAQFGPPVVAALPIGAYEPRWFMRDQHVNPDEAVQIMRDCGARQALGIHWGTFQLTDEPRRAPLQALAEACVRHGVAPGRFMALCPGDVWVAANETPSAAVKPA